jgi:DNA invertase Pin-like site-specific DNA recombinase
VYLAGSQRSFFMIPVALFVRVSTKGQDCARQIADLTAVATKQNYQIVQIIEETGSATKRNNIDRPEIETLLALCRSKTIKKVLVTEFSRLGRRRSETPVLMETIMAEGVSIYAHNLGIDTLTPTGKRNSVAGIVMAVMFEIDAMETERLSERILSGLDEARRRGKRLGRPPGTVKTSTSLIEAYPGAIKDLKAGLSIRQVSTLRSLSKDTVQRLKKAINTQNLESTVPKKLAKSTLKQ